MPVTHPPDLTMTADVPSMFDADGADRVTMVGRVRYPGTINSVEFIPNWTRAGANTNYRTLSLYNRGTAGAGTALVATLALTSGVDLTKFVSKTITLGAAADRAVAVGDVLQWVTSPTGSGAPDAGGRVIVQQSLTS
jgi:hypothetical protein